MRRTLTWKAAVAGGAVIGAGFGAVALAGAESAPTPPSSVELQEVERQLGSPGAPLSVVPAPLTDLDSVGSTGASISPASAPSPDQLGSVPSPDSPPSTAEQPQAEPAPAPAPEVDSPPSYDSPASPASIDSPPSPASIDSPDSIDS